MKKFTLMKDSKNKHTCKRVYKMKEHRVLNVIDEEKIRSGCNLIRM